MTDRVAIVTGAAGVLGSSIAEHLLADGAHVVLADIQYDAVSEVASRLAAGTTLQAVPEAVDLGSVDSIKEFVDRVEQRFGRIDVLVNNAAINRRAGLADLNEADWDVMSDVNLRGPAFLASACSKVFTRQGSGNIVNIASRSWVSGGPVAYVTMKAGIVGLTRALATELAPKNVRANAVAPSFIVSDFTAHGRSDETMTRLVDSYQEITPLPRMTRPEDIANAVVFLASEKASFITGEVIHVCGGAQMAPLPRVPLLSQPPVTVPA